MSELIGFDTYDAVNVALKWAEECGDVGYLVNEAGGWMEVFVDEYKRGMEMDDDQCNEFSDYDVLKYWHALLGEAIRHIELPLPQKDVPIPVEVLKQLELEASNEES